MIKWCNYANARYINELDGVQELISSLRDLERKWRS